MGGSWSGRRVLVTGATGLVGSWLVPALLERGAFVAGLVRDHDPQRELVRSGMIRNIAVVTGALEDFRVVERAVVEHDVDTIIHLGAQAIVGTALASPLPTFESNVMGTVHVLEAARRRADRVRAVVVASSDKAYGDSETLPYTEAMPPLGRHPYDVSKSCADLISVAYHRTYGLPVVVARCGNIYGGGDLNWSRIVPGAVRSLYFGQRPEIRSDGTFIRDYVYVRDAVDAYLSMAEMADRDGVCGEAFNFGPQRPFTVLEVVERLSRLMGRDDLPPKILGTAKGEIREQYLCSDKARARLGWAPAWSLDDGLKETAAWYRAYLEHGA